MLNTPRLGASLYVPCTHAKLLDIATHQSMQNVRSLILCTEDSVANKDLNVALYNLANFLKKYKKIKNEYRFIRVRNQAILNEILSFDHIEKIDGFVLPKITAENINDYMQPIMAKSDTFWVMPTLETIEVFDDHKMRELLTLFNSALWRHNILTLRIGGNDLLSLLKIRRKRGFTLYDTPLGQIIARLATTFIPYGFALSAPVFEDLEDTTTLSREIELDLLHGLQGKTAIHPNQVGFIEQHYRVKETDLIAAKRILEPNADGVFKLNGAMCEPATHQTWAESILLSAHYFGRQEMSLLD